MTPPTWESNATLDELAALLRPCRKVVVLTHVKPDGDAIGSTLGLVRTLNMSGWGGGANANEGLDRGGRAEAWYAGPMPPWLDAVAKDTPRRVVTKEGLPDVGPIDAVVVADTGSWSQVEPYADWINARRDRVYVIDHHVQGDPEMSARRHLDTGAAAVCQPMAGLCQRLLGLPALASLPQPVANALFLGLATDTGWFKHSNVNAGVMRTAGELLAAGAEHYALYREVEQRESLNRLRLLGRALGSIDLHLDDRLAVVSITRRDFDETHATSGDAGGFADYTQMMPRVEVTAILSEASPAEFGLPEDAGPITKISLRSKTGGADVDVNRVAKALGGGGHVRAAGARLRASLDQARAEVVRLVGQQLTGVGGGRA